MCEICADVIVLLDAHDERMQNGKGLHLSKKEIFAVDLFCKKWQQRQCLCCFKEYKNMERFNNIVQVIMSHSIKQIYSVHEKQDCPDVDSSSDDDSRSGIIPTVIADPEPMNDKDQDITSSDGCNAVDKLLSGGDPGTSHEGAGCSSTGTTKSKQPTQHPPSSASIDNGVSSTTDDSQTRSTSTSPIAIQDESCDTHADTVLDEDAELRNWTMEEKDSLFMFVTKVFLMNFPLYMAYKHSVQSSLDDVSQQEANVLNNYCESGDMPVYLLRNVCFFCDSNGLQSIAVCFDKATPQTLPYTVAHTLITIIANLRLWMNINTVLTLIVPIRSCIIRYMCSLSDQDLRLAGLRNMTDLMMTAVKDPIETHLYFDEEVLDLAFKYFTCSTLTIRLAGITQINNQISLHNEIMQTSEKLTSEMENYGAQLGYWLFRIKIIEHIFGPNLHVELIKQSQLILNFMATEGRITSEHIGAIWTASLMKHCSRQVHDILIPLIKNLELKPARHLLSLVSSLDPSVHNEQTIYLASELLKSSWCSIMASQTAMFSPKPRIMYHSTVASRSHSHSHSSDAEEESETCEEISNNSELCLETQRHIAIARRVKAQQHKGLKALTHTISDSDSSDEEGVVRGRRRIIPRKRVCQENICDDHELYDESEEEEGMSHIKPVTIDPDTSEYSSEEEEDPHDAHGQTHHHHHSRPNRHSLNHSIQSMESTEMSCEENTSGEQQHTCDSHTCACVHNDNCMVEDSDHKQLDTSKESLESSEEAQLLQEIANSNLNNATLNPDDKILYMQQIRENLLKSRKQHQHHQQHRLLHHRQHHQHHNSDYLVLESEVMSPEEDDSSCNSSRVSNQSEKNMADFDGEDVVSEDEIGPSLSAIAGHHSPATTPTSIAAGAADVVHRHDVTTSTSVDNAQHLESINNLFCQKQNIPTPKRTVRIRQDSCTNYNWDHVCHKGNTVLWDLIQDDQSMKLAEGIAEETEKALCNLLCVSADRKIRTKFIEACVENIANNRSVVVSLRLLPKLFNSFQQYRSSMQNTHTIAMWAEHDLSVMKHFFNNLIYYKKCQLQGSPQQQNTLYGHKEEVQVRLYFLTCMFSTSGSPNDFKLSSNQLSILWDCLVTNSKCSDDCLNWFLQQVKSKDQHALSVTTLQILFADKIPELGAEKMTMVGLNLFMQLLQFSKIAGSGLCTPTADQQFCGMNQLWRIALRAHNTDVSLNAIQSLNNYYIKSGINNLREEEEFVERSMESLVQASSHLEESPDTNLLIIQRGLILLTSHLEDFRKRYAFHLRNWKLAGCGIGSHQKTLTEKDSSPVRIILQPGGFSEKTTIQMYTSDLVSELRAEVTKWWQDLRTQQQAAAAAAQNDAADGAAASTSNNTHGQPTPILGSMLGEGPVRIITQGQELTVDLDEKTLADVQFKDLQIVFVSLGANRSQRKSDLSAQHPIQLEEHERQRLPMIFLLQDQHFSRLFSLLDQLTKFSIDDDSKLDLQFASNLEMKAHMLSKKVWELVMLLPTSPKIMDGFKNIKTDAYINWERLLPTDSSHKLMYSLQIVESLSRAPRNRLNSAFTSTSERPSCDSDVSVEGLDTPEEIWSQNFIDKGGLKHLFNIFLSGSLQQSSDTDHWDQWKQDCLAYLLRLLSQFAISDSESGDDAFDDSTQKKTRKSSKSEVKLVVPTLNQVVISMGQVEQTMKILLNIVYDAALPHEDSSHGYQTTAWGRVEVVHYALAFLVSLAHSYNQQVHDALCDDKKFPLWLKRLTLETPEPLVRKEVSHGLYRLFMGQTSKGISGYSYLLPMLEAMLIHLPEAQNIKQSKRWEHLPEDKETYGPCCRDYFWLTCRLVQSIKPEDVRCSWKKGFTHDLDSLAKYVADAIVARPFNEKRINTIEDYGLIGLLELMKSLARHRTPFFSSDEGHAFLKEAFNLLFALPSPEHRYFPKAKTHDSRSVVYDVMVEMVKGNTKNYRLLHAMVSKQHVKEAHAQYSWDNWPHEEGRSNCGYVGLTNLGATCYMATCMQHLYMIPEARKSVLEAQQSALNNQHEGTLYELKKMFAYLLESERKAYNPKSFCKVYTMDKQPLNTCEQKDMTEFFTDLISKMEEMGPQLKKLVKSLFGGVLTNNVVSLDCPHVSRTKEEFYTVRCQVADMKNLYESLDEVTVKDMLEGDNMYTCSRCQKKVRAEKRACFRTLPKILCFNTMRYTFNMITMTKEKVNTHFSFPLRLDMTGYMEENLIKIRGDEESSDDDVGGAVGNSSSSSKNNQCYQYQLIGVTVHTGTADGGHYYSFIRDKLSTNQQGQDKWFLFNDAEVKHFDPQQIASECFGGEMTSKTYDSVTDKFMDFSFEKTHSAYMLFYERIERTSSATSTSEAETSSHTQSATSGSNGAGTGGATGNKSPVASGSTSSSATQGSTSLAAMEPTAGTSSEPVAGTSSDSAVQLYSSTSICDNEDVCQDDDRLPFKIDLTKELLDMIWEDNMQFLQDKNVFETNYFWFMWQMCGFLQTTLEPESSGAQREEGEDDIALLAAKLTASFVLETFIHAKEKPTMLQWIELLTKQFNSCQSACEWFLDSMAEDDWWPQKNLIKCPSQVVRQMFQRLLIHVISQLRSKHHHLYLEPLGDQDDVPTHLIGSSSCVTRFIRKMLNIIAAPQKPNTRYLSEYFTFLFDFARMGEEECLFLIQTNAISTMINFYIGHKTQESFVDVISDDDDEDEDDDDILPMTSTEDRYRPQALEKMISLIALLVEKSRGDDKQLHLLPKDRMAIIGGKGYPFLINQIRDNINLRQTASLIINLCRWNDSQAILIIQMIFSAISKMGTESQNFFKILSLLMEYIGTVPGTPHFTQFILHKFWSIFDYCPQQCLDWLSIQVCRNKHVHQFVLQHLDSWVEHYLMAHANTRVRNSAAILLVSLVPSSSFRQAFRMSRSVLSPQKDFLISNEALLILHEIYGHLLKLLTAAPKYIETSIHGTAKLVAYFGLMTYCLLSKTEKLMFSQHFMNLWNLFQPKMAEPSIQMYQNKQALLLFWHQVCVDCNENVKLIVSSPHVVKQIAFNYIFVDNEDQELVLFNRCMLPAYYGILRMCCMQSPAFTRQLANHQNIQWAFRYITPFPTHYNVAVDELLKMMRLMVHVHDPTKPEETRAVNVFKKSTIQLYLQHLDTRMSWQTFVMALKILVENNEDKLHVLYHNGLQKMFEAFNTLHAMYHEATACHVTADLSDLLEIMVSVYATARTNLNQERRGLEVRNHLQSFKEKLELMRKLLTLLNSYTPPDIRNLSIALLKELVLSYQSEIIHTLVPMLLHAHVSGQRPYPLEPGPYFPRRGQKPVLSSKATIRPSRPQFQMYLVHNQLECSKFVDPAYDQAVYDYFKPYHNLVDLIVRVAVNQHNINEKVISLSAVVAYEGVPMHMPYFTKLWYEIYQLDSVDKKCIELLCAEESFTDYMEMVLTDERQILCQQYTYQFFCNFFPKVYKVVLRDGGQLLLNSLLTSLSAEQAALEKCEDHPSTHHNHVLNRIYADVRALSLVYSVQQPKQIPKLLNESLHTIRALCKQQHGQSDSEPPSATASPAASASPTASVSVASNKPTDPTPSTSRALCDATKPATDKAESCDTTSSGEEETITTATSADEDDEHKERTAAEQTDEDDEEDRSHRNGNGGVKSHPNNKGVTPSKRRRLCSGNTTESKSDDAVTTPSKPDTGEPMDTSEATTDSKTSTSPVSDVRPTGGKMKLAIQRNNPQERRPVSEQIVKHIDLLFNMFHK